MHFGFGVRTSGGLRPGYGVGIRDLSTMDERNFHRRYTPFPNAGHPGFQPMTNYISLLPVIPARIHQLLRRPDMISCIACARVRILSMQYEVMLLYMPTPQKVGIAASIRWRSQAAERATSTYRPLRTEASTCAFLRY